MQFCGLTRGEEVSVDGKNGRGAVRTPKKIKN